MGVKVAALHNVSAALAVAEQEIGALHLNISCRGSNQFKNNYFTEMCSGSEEVSYLRRIDFCITQL